MSEYGTGDRKAEIVYQPKEVESDPPSLATPITHPETNECCDHPGYTCDEFEDMLDHWDLADD